MSDKPTSIALLDSEMLLLIGHHTNVMAELAFRHDYGDDFQKHSERLQILQGWFQQSLDARAEQEHNDV